jgi:hypothetical protein
VLFDHAIAVACNALNALLSNRSGEIQQLAPNLTNATAQGTAIVMQPHLAARQEIGNRRDRFPIAACAGANSQYEIAERKPGALLEDLSISFHIVLVFPLSNSGAISDCEYLIHKAHAVIHLLFTMTLTARRQFCSIFKHEMFHARSYREGSI